jgi:predicted nucleic acid-binding protein
MHAFDASSLIHAWDNYPIDKFPPLWEWMAGQIQSGDFVVSEVALKEIGNKAPECATWLKEQEIQRLPMSNAIAQEALRIKRLLGIEDDRYHPKGVGENDILIIATAKVHDHTLVTEEGFQAVFPAVPAKSRIPTVCNMGEVRVEWCKFIDLIKASDAVFS